jgi:tRNA modification GTPase
LPGADEPDPIAADALIALAEARTERVAAILLDQYRGALRRELKTAIRWLESGELESARNALARLSDRSTIGLHLTRPWNVVLAGKPNVGKSSMMNAIVGFQRSIVFAEPGTTRDVLTATTALDGWPVELADTAGLHEATDAVEVEGVARAQQRLETADLVLWILDSTAAWGADDASLAIDQRPTLVVHNKCDLASPPNDGRPPGLAVSAKKGVGIDELCRAIANRLVPSAPQQEEGVPFTKSQCSLVAEALQLLDKGKADEATARLRTVMRQ